METTDKGGWGERKEKKLEREKDVTIQLFGDHQKPVYKTQQLLNVNVACIKLSGSAMRAMLTNQSSNWYSFELPLVPTSVFQPGQLPSHNWEHVSTENQGWFLALPPCYAANFIVSLWKWLAFCYWVCFTAILGGCIENSSVSSMEIYHQFIIAFPHAHFVFLDPLGENCLTLFSGIQKFNWIWM